MNRRVICPLAAARSKSRMLEPVHLPVFHITPELPWVASFQDRPDHLARSVRRSFSCSGVHSCTVMIDGSTPMMTLISLGRRIWPLVLRQAGDVGPAAVEVEDPGPGQSDSR